MKNTCCKCGKHSIDGQDWKKCSSCDEFLCTQCVEEARVEGKDTEKKLDAISRLRVLCPSCSSDFFI